MGIEIGIAAIGLGIAAAGTYVQYDAAQDQRAASQAALDIQRQQERLRKRQMQFEAQRRQREITRNAIQQRAYALASTTAQGASRDSALQGAYGQISSRSATNSKGVAVNESIGNRMFGFNESLLGTYRSAADASANAALGSGLTSLGGAVMTNAGAISRIGQQVAAPRTV
jgi:uncharacterized membrane protein